METKCGETEVELAGKDFKASIIDMFKDLKKYINIFVFMYL